MKKSQLTRVIAVLLAIVVGGYAVSRVLWSRSEAERAGAERVRALETAITDSRKQFKALAVAPLPELSSPEEVAQLMVEVTTGSRPPDDQAVRDITDFIASFVYYRFINSSVEEYKSWRRAEGYAFKKMADIYGMPEDYEGLVKEPPPPNASVEELFDGLWGPSLGLFDGYNKPVAIAREALGINITFGTATISDPTGPPLDGGMGHETWAAGYIGRLRGWFVPATHGMTFQEMLVKHETLECATVGVVFEFESGVRRPILLVFALDPTDRKWRLQRIAGTFMGGEAISPLEF